MTRIPLGNNTPEGVAKDLSTFAQLTAQHSQNWENYEAIILDVLNQVWAAARPAGYKLVPLEPTEAMTKAALIDKDIQGDVYLRGAAAYKAMVNAAP